MATEIKGLLEDFKPYIPLIQGLRNPGMRNRHWEQLSEELGFPIRPKATLTFSKCLEMKLQDHIAVIAKVAEVAGKEYSIEQVLGARCCLLSCEVPQPPKTLLCNSGVLESKTLPSQVSGCMFCCSLQFQFVLLLFRHLTKWRANGHRCCLRSWRTRRREHSFSRFLKTSRSCWMITSS